MIMDYLPKRMTLSLLPEVARALLKLAMLYNENPKDVATRILYESLDRRGLLQEPQADSPAPARKATR